MSSRPQCPFCLREFDTVEQVTQHLIFDNCQVEYRPADVPKKDAAEQGTQAMPSEGNIVPES